MCLGIAKIASAPAHPANGDAGKDCLRGRVFVFHNHSPAFSDFVLVGAFYSCGLIGLYIFNREILQEICDGKIGERLPVIV